MCCTPVDVIPQVKVAHTSTPGYFCDVLQPIHRTWRIQLQYDTYTQTMMTFRYVVTVYTYRICTIKRFAGCRSKVESPPKGIRTKIDLLFPYPNTYIFPSKKLRYRELKKCIQYFLCRQSTSNLYTVMTYDKVDHKNARTGQSAECRAAHVLSHVARHRAAGASARSFPNGQTKYSAVVQGG